MGTPENARAIVIDAPSVGAAARSGDRAALAELGRRGGKRYQERAKERRAELSTRVALETVGDRRTELGKAVAALQTADINEAQKVMALAAAIKLLNDLDAFDELAKENVRLRAALQAATASTTGPAWECTVPAPLPSTVRRPVADPSNPAAEPAPDLACVQSDRTEPSDRHAVAHAEAAK